MKKAVFLFDTTGLAAQPFTEGGWHTTIIDILNVEKYAENPRATVVLDWDVSEREADIVELCRGAEFVFGFPPCTDLTVRGSRWFDAKAAANPDFQKMAMWLAQSVMRVGEAAGIPWALENPAGAMSKLWKLPNYTFQPWQYAGYLPENDIHPLFPHVFPARDRYSKRTCVWASSSFRFPPPNSAGFPPTARSLLYSAPGGSTPRSKRIRSCSPRGFFNALYEVYK